MDEKKRRRKKAVLRHPGHGFDPEDLLNFIELPHFTRKWDRLFEMSDDDLLGLQIQIMSAPKAPPVIQGTGGLRKIRFAAESSNIGKSGAIRVCYKFFEDHGIVLLVTAFSHREQDNIPLSQRETIRSVIAEIKKELDSGRRLD